MKKYLLFLSLLTGLTVHGQTFRIPPKNTPVYNYVDVMPKPSVDLAEYLSENIVYPMAAKKANIQGRVIVKFVVNADGSISDVNVLRGIGGGCDEEAVRVIKSMPKWLPGEQNGKKIKTFYTLPIQFKLMDPKR